MKTSRHFNTHIEGIDLDFWHDLIDKYGNTINLNRGDFICRLGKRTNAIGYVKSGYLIYTVDGMSKIGGFTFPGALFGDYPNCMHNLPARFDIMAGRQTEICVMEAPALIELAAATPDINLHIHRFAEAAYNSLIERYCSLLAGSAQERYRSLVEKHPQIEQDVPQKEIAEYLQITPTHLSRIRLKLLKEEDNS